MPARGAFRFSNRWVPIFRSMPETGMAYVVTTIRLKDGREFKQAIVIEGLVAGIRGLDQIPFKEEDVAEVIATHDKWNWKNEKWDGENE